MLWLYRICFLPALILALPYYGARMLKRGGYKEGFAQRFGLGYTLPKKPAGGKRTKRIWLQAVSVGEVKAVGPLIEGLLAQLQGAGGDIVLTTTTSTGFALAKELYKAQPRVHVQQFPLDFWPFSALAWKRIQPTLVLLTEGELWPEHLARAAKKNVPAVLINARLSDRSFTRYLKFKPLAKALVLKHLSAVYAGSAQCAQRFAALGVPEAKLHTLGNLKLDAAAPAPLTPQARAQALAQLGLISQTKQTPPPHILLGASTWPGEEAALVGSLQQLNAGAHACKLILVPRHAERGADIIHLLSASGLPYAVRSEEINQTQVQNKNETHNAAHIKDNKNVIDIYLADTTGELAMFTALANTVFIGKSLAPNKGGQTPIEAAALGGAILTGPNMQNFSAVHAALKHAGGVQVIEPAEEGPEAAATELAAAVKAFIENPQRASHMGAAAKAWHASEQGATQRTLAKLKPLV